LLINAHPQGEAPVLSTKRIGAVKIFERLWSAFPSFHPVILMDHDFQFHDILSDPKDLSLLDARRRS
jgi:hypothetical protein